MHARTLATTTFLAVALSTGALLALAQTTKPVDANKDGAVSSKERRDTNRDGKLSHTEKAEAREQAQARWREADKNRDGGLSREEAKAGGYPTIERNFDAMDTNKDGKVTFQERAAWGNAHRKSGTTSSKPGQTPSGQTPSGQTSTGQTSSGGGLLPPR